MYDESDFILEENESIIRIIFPKISIFFSFFEILKIAFSVFWCIILYIVLKGHFENFHLYDVILFPTFILAGFYFLIGRHVLKLLRLYSSKYIITNKRVIIESNIIFLNRRIINIKDIKEIYLEFNSKKFGNIILGRPEPLLGVGGMNFGENKYSLNNVENVFEVVKTINVNNLEVHENEYLFF